MRERPGFWYATGVALMLLAFPVSIGVAAALILFVESRWADMVPGSSVAWAALLAVGSPMLIAGIGRVNHGRRLRAAMARPAEAVVDKRPPVPYLRAFDDDALGATPPDLAQINPLCMATREENFTAALQQIGPVMAIGRPGELLPPLGAERIYVDDAHWQSRVIELMSQARLVVLRLGASAGLWWEIEQALRRVPPTRLLFHGAAKDFPDFLARVSDWLPQPVAPPTHRRLSMSPPEYLMHFDTTGQAHFVRPGNSAAAWRSDLSKPLLPIYHAALRPVFTQLGMPWSPWPIPWRTISAFVAIFILGFGTLLWLALTESP